MPLATKNNAIIVKDGKLAENCGCCGGWWCYDEACSCDTSTINAISATFTAGNYLRHARHVNGWYASVYVLGARLSGTHNFQKQSNSLWTVAESPALGGITNQECDGNTRLSMAVSTTTSTLRVCVYTSYVYKKFSGAVANPYVSPGDAIAGSNFTFGEGPPFGQSIFTANGVQTRIYNTYADRQVLTALCTSNGRVWSQSMPRILNYFLGVDAIELGAVAQVANEQGSNFCTLNSVVFNQ